ncbi:MAG: hypothetical protein KBS52_01045 [Clostridiales bacterium]|nr:hypothetical protein [Candidatus Equinaster intestinalis]
MKRMVCLYALLCIFSLMIVLAQYNSNKSVPENFDIKIAKSPVNTYVLRSDGEKLKLYKSDKIIKTYDITPSSLPLTDQDNLKSGIILENYDDVLKIIEDFDG